MRTLPPPEVSDDFSEQIRAVSRAKYSRPADAGQASETEPTHSEQAPSEPTPETLDTFFEAAGQSPGQTVKPEIEAESKRANVKGEAAEPADEKAEGAVDPDDGKGKKLEFFE